MLWKGWNPEASCSLQEEDKRRAGGSAEDLVGTLTKVLFVFLIVRAEEVLVPPPVDFLPSQRPGRFVWQVEVPPASSHA